MDVSSLKDYILKGILILKCKALESKNIKRKYE